MSEKNNAPKLEVEITPNELMKERSPSYIFIERLLLASRKAWNLADN